MMEIKTYSDELEFLKRMLYEAIFWDKTKNPPSFEESLELDYVEKPLSGWMQREKDLALIAYIDDMPVGAVWYRFWTEADQMRGYIGDDYPVLVIGIDSNYRNKGIGKKLMKEIELYALNENIKGISLSVSKINNAINLYDAVGYKFDSDIGDSVLLLRIF
jgi:ribosomal protein S18 acetylase RimI-like enzyme